MCFLVRDTFSHAWHSARFPALSNRSTHWLHAFPQLAPVGCRLLSRVWQTVWQTAWHPLKDFPRFAPTERFPALGNRCMFLLRVLIGLLL